MPLLVTIFVCVGLFLLFPKGFKYLVGTWVGAMSGGLFWGLFILAWTLGLSNDPTWVFMAWSYIGFTIAGIFGGCVFAANG